MTIPGKLRLAFAAAAIVLVVGAAILVRQHSGAIIGWLKPSHEPATILVSGNIEAHQSVLGFKTVQSRIVELPFNEGQWVKSGTLIASVEDSDYRQQVKMAAAALEVQKRQLAAAEQNVAAAQKIVESDAADLELAKAEFSRADSLMQKGAGTIETRD
jgi:HlyD family secretion protein